MSEDEFLSDWKRRLPDSIRNSNLSEQDKAWGLDILANNDILEGMSDEDMGAQGFYMQDWATINTGGGEPTSGGGSGINASAAPAGTVAQQPFTPNNVLGGNWHPDAIKLQDESERLIAELKHLDKISTEWFRPIGEKDRIRKRREEISEQLRVNTDIINNLGGAPSSSQINKSNANRTAPLPAITFGNTTDEPEEPEAPVLVPDKVEASPAPVMVAPAAPAAPAARQPSSAAPQAAPVARQAAPSASSVAPAGKAAPAKTSSKPTGADLKRILANEQLAIDNHNKKTREAFEKEKTGTKTVKLGDFQGRGDIQRKHNVSLQELLRLNPHLKDEDKFYKFERTPDGTRRVFNPEFAGVEIKVPDRKNPPVRVTDLTQLPQDTLLRLKKQNGGYLSIEQGDAVGSEAGGSMDYSSDDASDTETPAGTVDSEGNFTINTDLLATRNQGSTEVDEEGEGEGIEVPQFTPLKIKPLTAPRPYQKDTLPSVPNQIKASYTPDEIVDIKIATKNIQENTRELESQNTSITPAIRYLERLKENVVNGDATAVDFGTYGQWQKEHPDAAQAISAGVQAASIWIGGGWSKTIQFKNNLEKANFASKRMKYARELAEAAFDSESLKLGRALTDAEIGTIAGKAFQKAGMVAHKLDPEDAMKIGKAIGKSAAKTAFWETLALSVAGVEHDGFALPDTANDKEIRKHLKGVLSDIRQVRHTNGGYNQWIPFGLGSDEISSGEVMGIKDIIDDKIAKLKEIHQGNEEQKKYLKANATPDNLLKLAKILKEDSKARLAAVDIAKANGIETDPSAGYEEINVGGQSVASKDFVIPQSNESRKKQMMEYMKGRLGYVPAGFDDMWRKDHPESTLQIKETPYGVFFTDGKGEWKQMSNTGGKQLQPHEVAANKAVQFGSLQPDGTYAPTEFIAGSGIKLGGIGTFGTPTEATKFRVEYTKKIKALRYADELRQMNEIMFRSMMPSQWGKANAKVAALVADMRQELIGVGSVSDFEQKLLKDLVANPTDFFRLQSTVRSTYEELIDKLSRSLVEDPQSFGLEVQMPKDRQAQLKNMKAIYRAMEAKNKAKMSEFERNDTHKYKYSQEYPESK
jgi:hypothetical protein